MNTKPWTTEEDGIEGRWYGLVDGYIYNGCCGCGMVHRIEVALIRHGKLVKRPKDKVAISFFLIRDYPPKIPLTRVAE